MQTLNQIAENIAYKLGDQFNETLRASIKLTILDYRSKYIRDDNDRNTLSQHFLQSITLQFEEVNLLEEFNSDFTCINSICNNIEEQENYIVLKSKLPFPTPVRLKSAGINPFVYLGRVDGSKAFKFVTLDKYPYYRELNYNSKTIYYTIINNHIYIINNLNLCDINESLNICNILITSIFENPSEAYNVCINGNTRKDDMPFPISRDMLVFISNSIIKGEYPLIPKDGENINIKPDKNDNN